MLYCFPDSDIYFKLPNQAVIDELDLVMVTSSLMGYKKMYFTDDDHVMLYHEDLESPSIISMYFKVSPIGFVSDMRLYKNGQSEGFYSFFNLIFGFKKIQSLL